MPVEVSRGLIQNINRIALFLSLFMVASVSAQTPRNLISAPLKESQKVLEDAEKELTQADVKDARLLYLRDQLSRLRAQARAAENEAVGKVRAIEDDLAALGPPPGAGVHPEAPNVAAKRKELNKELAGAEGVVKEAELVLSRSERLAGAIKTLRRTHFTERVLSRGISPLSPGVWDKLVPEWETAWDSAKTGSPWSDHPDLGRNLLLGLALALTLVYPLRHWLIRRYGYVAVEGLPSHWQRLRTAAFTGMTRALLPSLAMAAVFFSLWYDEIPSAPLLEVGQTALLALTVLFFVTGFVRAALAPYEPDWRLVAIPDYAARAVSRTVNALAVLFALDRVLNEAALQYDASVEWMTVQNSVFGLLASLALLNLLRRKVWATEREAYWRRLRYVLAVLVTAIPLTAVFGYAVLSRLLATQLLWTTGLCAGWALLYKITRESLDHALNPEYPLGLHIRNSLALGEDGAEILKFWLNLLAGLLILLIGIASLLWLWGVAGKDGWAWLENLLFGLKLGAIKISLADVFSSLLLFTGLLLATRLLQRALDRHIFPRTRLDLGLRHSIRSGAGYLGFLLAATAAIVPLGIDLSNLAIIAGALSVGIGFGLQTVVSNFISGLILLVERPIKAGDWVVIGEHQGYVKRISVRATEIGTFDRASVFIPNSSLIAGVVMNRTYADKVGRVVLPIGVSYDAEPRRVREILLEIALAHPEIRHTPPPNVLFRNFGDSALHFELTAFVHDVDKVLSVTSDLCFEIFDAFMREDIHIARQQRELRISLDEEQLLKLAGSSVEWSRHPAR